MSEYVKILHSLIVPDPKNRKDEFRLEQLAASIDEHGLLENLVVRKAPFTDDFVIIAGERRWRAIRLLVETGRLPPGYEIMCLVKDPPTEGEGTLLQLVENVQRLDPSPWHLGRRFVELVEAGHGQHEIAARIGKAQSHVSRLSQIAAGLCPALVRRLDKLGPQCLTVHELLSIARLCDEITGEPDERAQLELAQRLLGGVRKKPAQRAPGQLPLEKRVFIQYKKLAYNHVQIPRKMRPYVEAVVSFLEGRKKGIEVPE